MKYGQRPPHAAPGDIAKAADTGWEPANRWTRATIAYGNSCSALLCEGGAGKTCVCSTMDTRACAIRSSGFRWRNSGRGRGQCNKQTDVATTSTTRAWPEQGE